MGSLNVVDDSCWAIKGGVVRVMQIVVSSATNSSHRCGGDHIRSRIVRAQTGCNHRQQQIAEAMAKLVIDLFEVIKVRYTSSGKAVWLRLLRSTVASSSSSEPWRDAKPLRGSCLAGWPSFAALVPPRIRVPGPRLSPSAVSSERSSMSSRHRGLP